MRKIKSLFLLLPLIIILAACSAAANTNAASTGASSGAPAAQGQPPDFSKQPVEQKLAIGTLMLEGTDKAITAEEAKTLLPLWKAVKTLNSSSNTAAEELSSVYSQIQDAMTADQVQAIKDMSLKMEDTQALMQKYGVKMPQNPGGSQLTESERATRVAQFQAERGTTGRNNQGGNTGRIPGGVPGGFPGGEMPGGTRSGTPRVQGTPQPGQSRGMRGGGFNMIFVDPLIKLLEERAGA